MSAFSHDPCINEQNGNATGLYPQLAVCSNPTVSILRKGRKWADAADSSSSDEELNGNLPSFDLPAEAMDSSATSSAFEGNKETLENEDKTETANVYSTGGRRDLLASDERIIELGNFVKHINEWTAYPWLDQVNIVYLDNSVAIPIYLGDVPGDITTSGLSGILPIQVPKNSYYCCNQLPLIRHDRSLRSYCPQKTIILTCLEIDENWFRVNLNGVVRLSFHVSPFWKIQYLREIIAYNLGVKAWLFTMWYNKRQVFGREFCKVFRRFEGTPEIGVYLH